MEKWVSGSNSIFPVILWLLGRISNEEEGKVNPSYRQFLIDHLFVNIFYVIPSLKSRTLRRNFPRLLNPSWLRKMKGNSRENI